jgi:hypothetical protein
MKTPISVPFATTAILTLTEVKAAVERFDGGDVNVFDALDAIVVAVDAYQVAMVTKPRQEHRQHDAA